jgi:hypothetical protein
MKARAFTGRFAGEERKTVMFRWLLVALFVLSVGTALSSDAKADDTKTEAPKATTAAEGGLTVQPVAVVEQPQNKFQVVATMLALLLLVLILFQLYTMRSALEKQAGGH